MFNKKIIRDIKGKFQLNVHSCKPTVNEKLDNSTNRTNLEIACLITGYKKIYFTSKTQILDILDPILQVHLSKLKRINYFQYFLSKPIELNQQIFMIPHYEKENRTILYNKDGTRQAFLLFLRDMELNLNEFISPGSWAEYDNHYLTGLLLFYPKKDILFFYKIGAFKQHLINYDGCDIFEITDKEAFACWPETIKKQFYEYVKSGWLKSDTYKIYKKDQKEATGWLKKYEKGSVKKIKSIINGLEKQIHTLNRNY